MIKKLSLPFLFGIILLLSSCETTGICTEPVTPKLMIGFSANNNLGNPEDVDPPENLKIYGTKDNIDIGAESGENFLYPNLTQKDDDKRVALIFDVNRDSLTYIFKYDGNIFDTLKFKYNRTNLYVNENCGYKTVFDKVVLEYYSTNAIDSVILLTENIVYDTEQHIKIFNK